MNQAKKLTLALGMLIVSNFPIVSSAAGPERLDALESTNMYEALGAQDSAQSIFQSLRSNARTLSGSERQRASLMLGTAIRTYLDRHPGEKQRRADLIREALAIYVDAADSALQDGRIRHTREVSQLAYDARDKKALVGTFSKYLSTSRDEKGRYLALMDFADGLAKFGDLAAEAYFDQAVHARAPRDSVEAHSRYARYLIERGRREDALRILDRLDASDREIFVHVALLRQQLAHALGRDTTQVDEEINNLRRRLANAAGVGPIRKLSARETRSPSNLLRLPAAHAFSHSDPTDDSRGPAANTWLPSFVFVDEFGLPNTWFAPWVVNAAEVLWNEARGENYSVQQVIAWAIRNRGNISHNGGCACDCYPGGQGQSNTLACRTLTPAGPQADDVDYAESARRWSCVVHGGQAVIGGSHSQMDDSHQNMVDLDLAGMTWTVVYAANALVPDISSGVFAPPTYDLFSGNPSGAQEWRNSNYCAAMNIAGCKTRLGNIYGQLADPGACVSFTPTSDNWFWARKP